MLLSQIPCSITPVKDQIILPNKNKPIAVISDLHGPLLDCAWVKKEFCATYQQITGEKNTVIAMNWAMNVGRGLANQINSLEAEAKKYKKRISKDDILSIFFNNQSIYHDLYPAKARPHVRYFIRKLKELNIPLIILSGSGSDRHLMIRQIEEAGFIELIEAENIIGLKKAKLNGKKVTKDQIIEKISDYFYPKTTFIYFDDWLEGITAIKKLNGIIFGVPQELSFDKDKDKLIQAGVHYIVSNWKDWNDIIRLISVSTEIQKQQEKKYHFNWTSVIQQLNK